MKKICNHSLDFGFMCLCTASIPKERKSKKSWICETCLVICKWVNYKEKKNAK